jgi:hypothetical protein
MKNHEDSLSYFTKIGVDKEFGEFYENYSSFFDSLLNPGFQNVIESININSYKQPYSLYIASGENALPDGFSEYEYPAADGIIENAGDGGLIHSMETAYNEFFQTITDTKLIEKHYDAQRRKSVSLYKDIAQKSEKNIELIAAYLNENGGITPNDRQSLENLKRMFISVEYYALEYLRTLDAFENISILGGYIFPSSSLFERSKIMLFNRIIFGIHTNFKKEKEALRKQIFKLCALGNSINSSMYDYYDILRRANAFIDEKEHPGEKTYLGIEKRWIDRKAIQRILSIFLTVQSLINAFIAAMTSVNGNLFLIGQTGAIGAIIFSFCTGLGLSIFLHRFMIFIGKRNEFYTGKIKTLSKSDEIHFNNLNYISNEDTLLAETAKELKDLTNVLSKDKNVRMLAEKTRETENKIGLYLKERDSSVLFEINKEISGILASIYDNPEYKTFYSSISFKNLYIPSKIAAEDTVYAAARKSIVEASNEYLLKWRKVLNSGDINAKMLEIMRKYALQIIKITAFNENVFLPENKEQIISIIQDFSILYNSTIDKIKTIPNAEKEKNALEIESFEETGRYAKSYYKALSYAMNADILNGYRISKDAKLYFLEKCKILAAVRHIMGINSGIRVSEKGFLKSTQDLVNIGNSLIPNLYEKEQILSFARKYLISKTHPDRFDIGINEPWKIRKMLTRLFPLVFFLINAVRNSLYEDLFRLFTVFITGVGISVFMHWISIIYGLIHTKLINIIHTQDKQTISSQPLPHSGLCR